ncbi:MAG: S1 RNA-binding domain-containing protein, partial [Actinomycetota bacterium]|nr:S1 RNA-binding domain-containing protein [Actinomycetota bacterium]
VLADALQQAREARMESLDVMNAAIAAPRTEVAETAPKIVTITIPIDKVGEVIGPKGKIINTIQAETGADIAVDDDGAVGIVTIAAVESWRMEEARTAIVNIVDPPKAEIGVSYTGRVVNITKFGAFVNILPGRDGLLHISKIGRGKRINSVEDVLSLGDEVEVVVDEIDDRGKVSLSPAGDIVPDSGSDGASDSGAETADVAPQASGDGEIESVSFDESFDAELADELGDLGPSAERRGGGGRRRHR